MENEPVHTPPPVTGYRKLTQEEVDLMNAVKAKGDEIGALIYELRANANLDQRWVSIGSTQIQLGLMALVRAVAKPTNF